MAKEKAPEPVVEPVKAKENKASAESTTTFVPPAPGSVLNSMATLGA